MLHDRVLIVSCIVFVIELHRKLYKDFSNFWNEVTFLEKKANFDCFAAWQSFLLIDLKFNHFLFDEHFSQQSLIGKNKVLRQMVYFQDQLSCILGIELKS